VARDRLGVHPGGFGVRRHVGVEAVSVELLDRHVANRRKDLGLSACAVVAVGALIVAS